MPKNNNKAYEYVPEDWGAETMRIGEFDVPLPKMPAVAMMVNYNVKEENQKFHRRIVPKELRRMPENEQKGFIEREFHIRRNGYWILIKGQPFYISGTADLFFNHWNMKTGGKPDFRMEALEYFLFWNMCWIDPYCLGMLDIKARRIGDSEKTLCILWEHVTGYRHADGGMQNTKDKTAQKNFLRIVHAHSKMPFFYKPVNKGKSKPTTELVFEYPAAHMTRKKIKSGEHDEEEIPPLDSRLDFETTRTYKYDGEPKTIYHMDEPGKIDPSDMDVVEQWDVMYECMTTNSRMSIRGKGLLTTTVEDIAAGATIEKVRYLWDNSDPNDRDENGRTITGLYRIYRNFEYGAKCDEYGFHKREEARHIRANSLNKLMKKGQFQEVLKRKRKQPDTIDDVWRLPAEDCVLHPHLLDMRINQLENGLNWDNEPFPQGEGPRAVRGDLVWQDEVGGAVQFVPSPNGRWWISHRPERPNYLIQRHGILIPGNREKFRIGVDPIDQKIVKTRTSSGKAKKSKLSISVYKMFDPIVDSHVQIDPSGEILDPWNLTTDKFVCIYLYRPENPFDGYLDVLKTCIYFGAQAFIERDKPYITNCFNDNRNSHYLQLRPRETNSNPKSRPTGEQGIKATAHSVNLYTDLLIAHVATRIHTYDFLPQLNDMRQYNVINRTHRDLTVSSGMALLGGMDSRLKKVVDDSKTSWDKPPWQTYKRTA